MSCRLPSHLRRRRLPEREHRARATGTAHPSLYRQGDGIVFDQPTIVALHTTTGAVVATGDEAWELIGGDSGSVVAIRPLREGTVTEFEMTQRYLRSVMRRVAPGRFPKPRVLVCIPSESSGVEKRALEEAITSSGGKQVTLVEEALAAAIGAGLPIHEPVGHLIVDIGGARSEMAVVSMGGVVSGHGVPVAQEAAPTPTAGPTPSDGGAPTPTPTSNGGQPGPGSLDGGGAPGGPVASHDTGASGPPASGGQPPSKPVDTFVVPAAERAPEISRRTCEPSWRTDRSRSRRRCSDRSRVASCDTALRCRARP